MSMYLAHMTPRPGIEPGPHWWEASALTTAPSQLPQRLPALLQTNPFEKALTRHSVLYMFHTSRLHKQSILQADDPLKEKDHVNGEN